MFPNLYSSGLQSTAVLLLIGRKSQKSRRPASPELQPEGRMAVCLRTKPEHELHDAIFYVVYDVLQQSRKLQNYRKAQKRGIHRFWLRSQIRKQMPKADAHASPPNLTVPSMDRQKSWRAETRGNSELACSIGSKMAPAAMRPDRSVVVVDPGFAEL